MDGWMDVEFAEGSIEIGLDSIQPNSIEWPMTLTHAHPRIVNML